MLLSVCPSWLHFAFAVSDNLGSAKRAYLSTIAFPPSILTSSTTGVSATIRPYDGPDAQAVIQNVNARGQHTSNPSRSHNARSASVSVFPNSRTNSNSSTHANNGNHHMRNNTTASGQHVAIPERSDSQPSPTLPSLPSHPTLNALISSSLGEAVAGTNSIPSDPAILTTSLQQQHESLSGPRIGDPGKRMLGAALGVRHPGLGPRVLNGGGSPSPIQGNGVDHIRDMQRAMGGLVVAE